jgi:hypothetical protein
MRQPSAGWKQAGFRSPAGAENACSSNYDYCRIIDKVKKIRRGDKDFGKFWPLRRPTGADREHLSITRGARV